MAKSSLNVGLWEKMSRMGFLFNGVGREVLCLEYKGKGWGRGPAGPLICVRTSVRCATPASGPTAYFACFTHLVLVSLLSHAAPCSEAFTGHVDESTNTVCLASLIDNRVSTAQAFPNSYSGKAVLLSSGSIAYYHVRSHVSTPGSSNLHWEKSSGQAQVT